MNELTVSRNTLPIKSVAELQIIGELFDQSGMFGCVHKGQGLVLAMTCHMENKTPIEFNEIYHLIDGKPSMRADAMLVNLEKHGGNYKILKRDGDSASAEFTYKGRVFVSSMSWAEAQQEPYIYERDGKTFKKNWRTPRARMQTLWARVVSDGVRTVCPLANKGSCTPEENQDISEVEEAPIIIDAPPMPPPPPPVNETIIVKSETKQPDPETIISSIETVKAEMIDYSVIPFKGADFGKSWKILNIEQLLKCRNNKAFKSIKPEHIVEIDKEIERQKAEKTGANE